MNDVILVQYALQRIEGKSVITLPREDWHRLVLPSGEPTRFEEVPRPLGGLMRMAAHVITAGSGIANPDAGIDVVRYDPDDAPYIYNIDHYAVIENFSKHPAYPQAVSMVGASDSPELRVVLLDNVFIVGPHHLSEHWTTEIPERIRNAKQKRHCPGS